MVGVTTYLKMKVGRATKRL